MNPLVAVLPMAMPFVGIVVLAVVLNRWGSKRDPMGGSPKDRYEAAKWLTGKIVPSRDMRSH